MTPSLTPVHVIFVFNKTRLAIVCGRLLLVDARPLLLHLQTGGVVRFVTAAADEPVDEVGCQVRADEPQPPQGGKPERDEESRPEHDTGHTDPEEREYDGGEQGDGDGAEHEGGEEEDRDEGEQQLGDDEGLRGVERLEGSPERRGSGPRRFGDDIQTRVAAPGQRRGRCRRPSGGREGSRRGRPGDAPSRSCR